MDIQVGNGEGLTEEQDKRMKRQEFIHKLLDQEYEITSGNRCYFTWQAVDIEPTFSKEISCETFREYELIRIKITGLRHDHLYEARLLEQALPKRPYIHLYLFFDLDKGIQDAPLNDPYHGNLVAMANGHDEDDLTITLRRAGYSCSARRQCQLPLYHAANTGYDLLHRRGQGPVGG